MFDPPPDWLLSGQPAIDRGGPPDPYCAAATKRTEEPAEGTEHFCGYVAGFDSRWRAAAQGLHSRLAFRIGDNVMSEPNQDDLGLNAAALFAHIRKLGDDPDASYLWSFSFSSSSADDLEEAAEQLGELTVDRLSLDPDHIQFELAEESLVIEPDGSETPGPPVLFLEFTRALSETQLAELHEAYHGQCVGTTLTYEGVSNYDLPEGDDWERAD
jgi:hypothetical protein